MGVGGTGLPSNSLEKSPLTPAFLGILLVIPAHLTAKKSSLKALSLLPVDDVPEGSDLNENSF